MECLHSIFELYSEMEGMADMVGKALFLASGQASIGSVLLSSAYSVKNFSKDQRTLQSAATALRAYIIMSGIWTVASMLTLYASNGCMGAAVGLALNLAMILWIILTYYVAFNEAVVEFQLKFPHVMHTFEYGFILAVLVCILYFMYCRG
jgi:hypothetical protein